MNKFLRDDILPIKNDNSRYRNFSDLAFISIWMIVTFISVIVISENVYIKTILAIPMILFVSGYLLMAALFPRKDDLGMVERISLSLGLSIVTVSILGLLLNFTFGIRLIPILITLCVYTIVLIFITINIRKRLSEDIQFSLKPYRIYDAINNWLRPKSKIDSICTVILILMATLTIGTAYYTIATPKIGEGFTEFYILDSFRGLNNYSTNLISNSPATWLISVTNHEYEPVNYTLQIVLDKNVLSSRQLKLDHNQRWEKNITLIPNKEGTDKKLEFLLFKDNNLEAPYRSLYLWINVT